MPTNRRKHCKATPYKLELDGKEFGCYEHQHTAQNIGKGALMARDATHYVVRDLKDNVIDSSD